MNRLATVSLQISLAAVLSLMASGPTLAQLPRTELWVSGDIAVFSNFSDRVGPGFDESEVQTSGFAGGLLIPFVSSYGRTIVLVEPSYRMRRFHPTRLPTHVAASPGELHEVSVQLTFRRQLSRRWALILQAVSGVATDFVGPNALEDGIRYQGAVLTTYSLNDHTTLGLGGAYGNAFGTDFPIPLILVDWNDGGRWQVTATLPGELETWYHTTEALALGVQGSFEGSNYTTSTLFPAEKPRLQYLAAKFGPAIQWQVGPHLAFTADGGWSLQRVRLYDGNREVAVNSNYDLKPTVFLGSCYASDLLNKANTHGASEPFTAFVGYWLFHAMAPSQTISPFSAPRGGLIQGSDAQTLACGVHRPERHEHCYHRQPTATRARSTASTSSAVTHQRGGSS